jgi:hypothetical protein
MKALVLSQLAGQIGEDFSTVLGCFDAHADLHQRFLLSGAEVSSMPK